ncbi:dual specificity protein phosphatase 8 [Plakobranchus ocellatus]|uniref:protein-tyrosine-phosphatase n=1 Tax=Plakobranchus ocellatus TaxID=259542 RepID=A0AAV3Z5M6_9GAST|nr:dual specificity protein phosphatase 8 [Plakobranchus ocellatus]
MVVVCLIEEQRVQYTYPYSALYRSRSLKLKDSSSEFSPLYLTDRQSCTHIDPDNMAEFASRENVNASPTKDMSRTSEESRGPVHPSHPTARVRRKLGRGDSKSWFNKSFDQTVLNQATKPKPQKMIRRQNSVTDFFYTMLTKSKTHLQDIFASKKEKPHRRTDYGRDDSAGPFHVDNSEHGRSLVWGESGSNECDESQCLHGDTKNSPQYSFRSALENNTHASSISSFSRESDYQRVSLSPNPTVNESLGCRRLSDEKDLSSSPQSKISNMDMFLTSKPSQQVDWSRSALEKSPGTLASPSKRYQSPDGLDPAKPETSRSAAMRRKQMAQSASLSPPQSFAPRTIVTLSSYGSADSAEESDFVRVGRDDGKRSVSSAPSSRLSTCWDGHTASPSLLEAGGATGGKRTLVKSNSDTFARLDSTSSSFLSASSPQLVYKTSSEGKNSLTQFLTSGVKSVGTIMIRVTDYLFLGSIEAAYNEPILCKYGISSLIDMTNVNPALVPAHKKSDCPCACAANKTPHFRSKLNIGVDDIEWENLEQYFDEINSFINGARRKGRRVLVFSYMGQSRAAAAVVQHLMTHYKMPYKDAMTVVRSKRPQIKLNSGFVKALRRLEKKLGLTTDEAGGKMMANFGDNAEFRESSPVVSRGSVEAIERTSNEHPPVVRGAWLEC